MSMHTRCTHCEAVFRVTLLQLQSSSGRVRCGVCHEVFDAFVHLRAANPPPEPAPLPQIEILEEPRPALEVCVELEFVAEAESRDEPQAHTGPDEQEAPAEWLGETDGDAAVSATPIAETDQFVIDESTASAPPEDDSFTAPADDTPGEADGWPAADEDEDDEPGTAPGAAGIERSNETNTLTPALAIPPPPVKRQRWLIVAGVSAALVVLAGQTTYQFRTSIATALPALRPALESACTMVGCDVPLPRLPERLVIETSDLRALDPSRPNRVVLATTVRNSAPMPQAYPMLELSLTDARDKLTARKVFGPDEYLDPPPAKGIGLGANAEFSARMQLDIGDIEASGYRIYLFHR